MNSPIVSGNSALVLELFRRQNLVKLGLKRLRLIYLFINQTPVLLNNPSANKVAKQPYRHRHGI